jgi:hypothetical protein
LGWRRQRLRANLVFDGADVRAGGAEEAQAVAAGGRLDLQQHPARRAEVHRSPPLSVASSGRRRLKPPLKPYDRRVGGVLGLGPA